MHVFSLALALMLAAPGVLAQPIHGHHHRQPTLSLSFNPANPTIPDNGPVGTLIATIIVTVSDGSPFMGALGFGSPYSSAGGICAIEGRTLILGAPLPPGDSVQNCTITASQ